MGEMKDLYTRGVSDLTSYQVGLVDGKRELLESIARVMEEQQGSLAVLPANVAFSLLITIYTAELDEKEL
jgi:hypothetical protein